MGRGKVSAEYATRAEVHGVRDDVLRAIGVLGEHIDSRFVLMAEAMTSLRFELKADVAALEERLAARIAIVEEVVRQNSSDIQQLQRDVQQLQLDVRQLQLELTELRAHLERRDLRLDELERRIAIVEQRLGLR